MKRILSIQEMKESLWPEWFQEAFQGNLQSCFLHGNCLMPGFSPLKAPWLISFILLHNEPEHLAELQPLTQKATKQGLSFGYFFTPEILAASTDTFPLEFLHIAHRHEVLIGAEPLEGFVPDKKSLRLQCERELRGFLIHLRREYVYMLQGHTKLDFFLNAEARLMPILYGIHYLLHGTYPEDHEILYNEYPGLRILPPTHDDKELMDRATKYLLTLAEIVKVIDTMEIQ